MIKDLIELTGNGLDENACAILITLGKSGEKVTPFMLDWIMHGILAHVHASPHKCHYFYRELNELNDLKNENLEAMSQ